eukprot:474605-Pyramimonas_sp.AAC.1
MRLNHASFTSAEGGADLAGAPAMLSVSATNGMGMSIAGAPASVVASATSPALAGDAGCPAGVVIGAAAVPVIIAVTRFGSSRRPLSSFAPRTQGPHLRDLPPSQPTVYPDERVPLDPSIVRGICGRTRVARPCRVS